MKQTLHEKLVWTSTSTPLGELVLVSNGNQLQAAFFEEAPQSTKKGRQSRLEKKYGKNIHHGSLPKYVSAVKRYFRGDADAFQAFKRIPSGTDFQKRVWAELHKIPAGTIRSYGAVAKRIGRPRAARAVGGACNKNPLALFVPCHRVVGENGKLIGYAAGISRKAALLNLEKQALKKETRKSR